MSSAGRAWIDGAARGNPGEAGFGVILECNDERSELGGFLGRTTNNVAEYAALVAALTLAGRLGLSRLEVFSDSELVARQMSGQYRVKAPHLVPTFLKILALKRSLGSVVVQHVPREQNRDADRLANRAIDERLPLPDWLEREIR